MSKSLGAAAVALLAAAVVQAQEPPLLEPGTMAARLAACTACHGQQGKAGPDGYYPRIAGKPADYLYNQLVSFREGRRQYRPMQNLLVNMSDEYLHQIAAWFSDQHPPYADPVPSTLPDDVLARGRQLALFGDAQRKIPACVACHGPSLTGVLPAAPALLGLPHDYVASQLGAWTNGLRKALAPDCMGEIARRLTPEDVGAVAGWLSSREVADPMPAPFVAAPTPLECGSRIQVGGPQ